MPHGCARSLLCAFTTYRATREWSYMHYWSYSCAKIGAERLGLELPMANYAAYTCLEPELFFLFADFIIRYLVAKIHAFIYTVKPIFKTTWAIGTAWGLRTAVSVPRSIQYIEMALRNKTTSEFRTVFDSPLGVPNSQVLLYIDAACFMCFASTNLTPAKDAM